MLLKSYQIFEFWQDVKTSHALQLRIFILVLSGKMKACESQVELLGY